MPDIEKLIKLANLLNTSVDYLLGYTDNSERPNAESPDDKKIFESLHWDGILLKPEEIKSIRELLQIVVRDRLSE